MDESDRLKKENERMKKDFSEKYGAKFSKELNLPPGIENQWLNSIEQFEKAHENSKMITVFKFIGKPVFKPLKEISSSNVKYELDKFIGFLSQKGINIDTICKVENKELYRFITEELFNEEIEDIHIKGFTWNYIYEEFHPNHEYDIKEHTFDFIESLLNIDSEFFNPWLSGKFIDINGEEISEKEAVNILKAFRDSYSEFDLQNLAISKLTFDEKDAKVILEIKYDAKIEGSSDVMEFSGEGECLLTYKWDCWCICGLKMPGISI